MASYSRFLQPYYMINFFFVAFAYSLLRYLTYSSHYFVWKQHESNAWFVFIVVLLVKSKKERVLDAFVRNVILFAKVVCFWMLYNVSVVGLAIYSFIVVVLFFLPGPSVIGDSNVEVLTPFTFEVNVRGPETPRNRRCLIAFVADWSPPSQDLEVILADLSNELRERNIDDWFIGKIDIVRHPTIAQDLKISDSGFKRDIPSLVLFKGGEEVKRCPDSKLKTKWTGTRKSIVKLFKLPLDE